jgi:hypothetical protein
MGARACGRSNSQHLDRSEPLLRVENKQQVLTLARLANLPRPISKAGGIPVRPPRGWGREHPKPAIEVSTDPGDLAVIVW